MEQNQRIIERIFNALGVRVSVKPLAYLKEEIGIGYEVFSNEVVKGQEAINKNIKENSPKHRYYHYEKFNNGKSGTIVFILFNPSNATPEKNDATVKMCREIVQENYQEMIIINLFSERSTKSSMFNKAYMENSQNNNINMCFINSLFQNIDLTSSIIVKAWGFAKNDNYKEVIKQVEELIPSGATKKIIGINERAANMNHHPGCIKWIGGVEFAELKDEYVPMELDA